MPDSVNPNDFRAFSRASALNALRELDEQNDIDPEDAVEYASMDNDELEAEICLSGIVHDTDMVGVFDNDIAASFALVKARSDYQDEA